MHAVRVTIKFSDGHRESQICREDGSVWRSIDNGEWISKDAPSIVSVQRGRLDFVAEADRMDMTPHEDPKPTAEDARRLNAEVHGSDFAATEADMVEKGFF